jgi:hypothetical protein
MSDWQIWCVLTHDSWPGVSSKVFGMLVCKNIDGQDYLMAGTATLLLVFLEPGRFVADFTLRCGDSRWNDFLPFTLAMVVVYPIGCAGPIVSPHDLACSQHPGVFPVPVGAQPPQTAQADHCRIAGLPV